MFFEFFYFDFRPCLKSGIISKRVILFHVVTSKGKRYTQYPCPCCGFFGKTMNLEKCFQGSWLSVTNI